MAEAETATTVDRLRAAEKSVARARAVLEKAESGLHAAETVTEKAEEVTSHPMRKLFMLLLLGGLVALIVWLVRAEN